MARHDDIKGKYVYLDIHGTEYRIYYEENGKGIPLICQHSAGSHGQQFRRLMNDIKISSRYRVIAPDLPYHGKSLPPESEEWWKEEYGLTKAFYIEFLSTFCHALNLEKSVFLGACMGGCLAVDIALERSDEFRAVIGLETGVYNEAGPMDWWDNPRVSNNFKGAAMWSMMAPESPENQKRETIWCYNQGAPPVLKGDFYYYFFDYDARDKAHLIDTEKVSVYLLTGEFDPAVSPDDSRILAKEIKGAKFTEMEGVGHFSVSENYEVLKRYLMPIFKEIHEQY